MKYDPNRSLVGVYKRSTSKTLVENQCEKLFKEKLIRYGALPMLRKLEKI